MNSKEALPKAAFQYGVKMADGRRTRKYHKEKNEKAELDREWQKIQNIILQKRKGPGEPSSSSARDVGWVITVQTQERNGRGIDLSRELVLIERKTHWQWEGQPFSNPILFTSSFLLFSYLLLPGWRPPAPSPHLQSHTIKW